MKIEKNPLHNPEVAEKLAPGIEETTHTYETLNRIPEATKRYAKRGGVALLGAGMVAGLLSSGEGPIEPIDFENTEMQTSEDGVNILEAPDGTQYQGVWLDGATGSSWADLGLSRKERQRVLEQNGLDAVPNEPTTIFVETDLLNKDE
jgi:hypothetical protein